MQRGLSIHQRKGVHKPLSENQEVKMEVRVCERTRNYFNPLQRLARMRNITSSRLLPFEIEYLSYNLVIKEGWGITTQLLFGE